MKPSLAELLRRRDSLFTALDKESDRGVALLFAAFLDDLLETLLRSRFAMRSHKAAATIDPLFDTLGPLGSFAAKCRLAYAIDAIPKWIFVNLESLRRIRNEAAHSAAEFTFDLQNVRDIILSMTSPPITAQFSSRDRPSGSGPELALQRELQGLTEKPVIDQGQLFRVHFGASMTYIAGLLSAAVVVLESDMSDDFRRNFLLTFDQAR